MYVCGEVHPRLQGEVMRMQPGRVISFDDFLTLRAGDQVLWRGRYIRTVIAGPGDKKGPLKKRGGRIVRNVLGVEFSKQANSWTDEVSVTAHYCWNDVRHIIRKLGTTTRNIVTGDEAARLAEIHIGTKNIRKHMRRSRGWAKTRGPCRALVRAERLLSKSGFVPAKGTK